MMQVLRATTHVIKRARPLCGSMALRLPIAAITPRAFPAAIFARCNSTTVAASDIREGDLIELEGGLWRVISRVFSRTAMGRAYVQAEIRSIADETKRDLRFRSEDMLTKAVLDTPGKYSVLYSSGDSLACMHAFTYEQIELPLSLLGDKQKYVQDGITLVIESYKGNPTVITLPQRISVLVKEMDEGGGVAVVDTALTPEAAFSNQWKVRVPKFIKVGDKITIDTVDSKYVGRD